MAKRGSEKKPLILRVKNEMRAEQIALICEELDVRFILGIEPDMPEDISDLERYLDPSDSTMTVKKANKIGRNDPCPCGSGKKFKKCCIDAYERTKTLPADNSAPRCGLCGKTTNLTKTPCCDQWICDDESEYIMFSFQRNSCYRNHSRFTLCGIHYNESHNGHWKDCEQCADEIDAEMYAFYGTNEYNFEVLENPPEFELKKCDKCGAGIDRGRDTMV